MRIVKWVLLVLIVVFVLIQVVRPAMTSPSVDQGCTLQAATPVPAPVDQIVRRSCYDCHSSETRYPWYSKVAPVSWLLASDVNEGRGELNFSEWATYSKVKQAKKLNAICRETKGGDMPPWYYLPMHAAAKLSDGDRQTLCGWATAYRTQLEAAMTPAERQQESRRPRPKAENERD